MNYFERIEDNINKHSIDMKAVEAEAKVEQELQKQDEFEKEYKHFFVDGILNSLIEGYIANINIYNVKDVNEPQEFEFKFIEETLGSNNGISKYLSYNSRYYYKTIYRTGYQFSFKSGTYGHNVGKDELIKYVLDVLSSKLYEIKEISTSEWETTVPEKIITGGPWNDPQSSYKRMEKTVKFKCTIKQLISLYYMECLRYSYIFEGKEYKEKSANYIRK